MIRVTEELLGAIEREHQAKAALNKAEIVCLLRHQTSAQATTAQQERFSAIQNHADAERQANVLRQQLPAMLSITRRQLKRRSNGIFVDRRKNGEAKAYAMFDGSVCHSTTCDSAEHAEIEALHLLQKFPEFGRIHRIQD